MSYKKESAARLGQEGERRVAEYLRSKGYIIIKRNFRDRYGEIDIIAQNDELIIFVEVKTRKENSAVPIEETVDVYKKKRLILTAEDYLSKSPSEKQPRFDVALVTVRENVTKGSGYSLKYIENAF